MAAILHTSSQFACVTASGADWREVGRKILESLESIRTEGDGMTLGFLYATEKLCPDFAALLTLLKSVTRIDNWYGATGAGICGNGISHVGVPAATVMIGRLPEGSFHSLVLPSDFSGILPALTHQWLASHQPSAMLTHGLLCAPAARTLDVLREKHGLYTAGGFSSTRNGCIHIAGAQVVADHPLSGVLLDEAVQIMVASSQGCIPAGPAGEITSCHENTIDEIDGRPALDVLQDAVEHIQLPADNTETATRKGHIHAAFPVSGIDTGALMVRNITIADEENRSIAVAHHFHPGDTIQFIYRDRLTAMSDLLVTLKDLHKRARHMVGEANLKPKALLYFGCTARMPDSRDSDEAVLIRDIFGDIPMAGFYTAAEVCNGHVYGYTGVAVLIL